VGRRTKAKATATATATRQFGTAGGTEREISRREPPSRRLDPPRVERLEVGLTETVYEWANAHYYGLLRRYAAGSPLGGGPYAVLSISATDETARHDWRDYQALKNFLVGEEWEAVELYPSESRLVDPSNRFYLWCFPPGVIPWGLPPGRRVLAVNPDAPQRPFPKPKGGLASGDGDG
jgi:hypothetical protein